MNGLTPATLLTATTAIISIEGIFGEISTRSWNGQKSWFNLFGYITFSKVHFFSRQFEVWSRLKKYFVFYEKKMKQNFRSVKHLHKEELNKIRRKKLIHQC